MQRSQSILFITRIIFLFIIFVLFVYLREIDQYIAASWCVLRKNRIFKWDSFEPAVATVSFLSWHLLWYILDVLATQTKLFKFINQWSIQKSDDMSHWYCSRIQRHIQELVLYIVPLLLYDVIFPRRKLPETPPTFLQMVFDILSGLIVYDFLFYWIHIAMHKHPKLYEHHKEHHTRTIQRASQTVRLSAIEQVLDVSCSIAAVNMMKLHPLSRAWYNVVITYLLMELHSASPVYSHAQATIFLGCYRMLYRLGYGQVVLGTTFIINTGVATIKNSSPTWTTTLTTTLQTTYSYTNNGVIRLILSFIVKMVSWLAIATSLARLLSCNDRGYQSTLKTLHSKQTWRQTYPLRDKYGLVLRGYSQEQNPKWIPVLQPNDPTSVTI